MRCPIPFALGWTLVVLEAVTLASTPPTVPARVILSVLNAPVPPGGVAMIAVSNPDGTPVHWQGNPFHVYQSTGELVFPFDVPATGPVQVLAAFTTVVLSLPVPAAHPGTHGSFLLIFQGTARAAVRLDVGVTAPSHPSLHLLPGDTSAPWSQHGALFTGADRFRLANASPSPVTFGPNATLRVRRSVGEPILASASLSGFTLAPHTWQPVTVPLLGLAPGPYIVEAEWIEPSTGLTVLHRHGVRTVAAGLDLQMPGGRTLPLGGVLPISLHWNGAYASNPIYAVVAGSLPGTTWLAGHELPVAFGDPLVSASLTTDLLGTLINGQGTGGPLPLFPGIPGYLHEARDIWLAAPQDPGLTGFHLRLAAIVYEPTTQRFLVSQPETVRIG